MKYHQQNSDYVIE